MYNRKKFRVRYTFGPDEGVFLHSIYRWDGNSWVLEELNNINKQKFLYDKICKKEKVANKYKGVL